DLRHAGHRCTAVAGRRADPARVVGHHARRVAAPPRARTRHRALAQLDSRAVPRTSRADRLLPLPARLGVDGARPPRAERHPGRRVSVLARSVAADRDDASAGGGGMTAIVDARTLVREYRMGDEVVHALRGVSLTVLE